MGSGILEFLVFLYIPLFVKTMAPEQTDIGVCLVVALASDVFERMKARFALFGFEIRRVDLEISLAT